MQKIYVVLKYWQYKFLLEQSSCTWRTVPEKIKTVYILQYGFFVFLFWYSHITISLLDLFISRPLPLFPSHNDVARFWDTQSFMQWYWYVYRTTLPGMEPKICGTEQTWICETCSILCCKTGCFAELYPYQNIFVYLFLSRIV